LASLDTFIVNPLTCHRGVDPTDFTVPQEAFAIMNPLLRRWISLCSAAALALLALYHLTDLGRGIDFDSPLANKVSSKGNAPKPIDWKTLAQHYPLSTLHTLPTGAPVAIPKIQANFPGESADRKEERLKRRDAVKEAFDQSWKGYTKYAW
jgi:mannosyl-oligosaccharide alpha-1,2-mannosidase